MRNLIRLEKPKVVLGADQYCIDASARQNAEQQLSQAAELNFVSLSVLFGVTLQLSASYIES